MNTIPTLQYLPCRPTITNDEGARSAINLDGVIAQFSVETHARYRRTPSLTWCNIFVWDVTSALGAEIPHWMWPDGRAARPADKAAGAVEMLANDMLGWLTGPVGRKAGWVECSRQQAQQAANAGCPVVGVWKAPAGQTGHVAIVRPGEWRLDGPWMAQAGARNFERAVMRECFGVHSPRFFRHA